jgi:ferritin-like metal-binding protein YciE
MAAQMETLDDLFTHELGDILYAERVLEKALPKLASEASDGKLKEAFESHLEETRGQIRNLEQIFDMLGKPVRAQKCPGIDGIKKEHDDFMSEQSPAPDVRDVFLTGAGARAEHYEIAAYSGLIQTAKAMGEDDCVRLLEENLAQEKKALSSLATAGQRLAKQQAKSS